MAKIPPQWLPEHWSGQLSLESVTDRVEPETGIHRPGARIATRAEEPGHRPEEPGTAQEAPTKPEAPNRDPSEAMLDRDTSGPCVVALLARRRLAQAGPAGPPRPLDLLNERFVDAERGRSAGDRTALGRPPSRRALLHRRVRRLRRPVAVGPGQSSSCIFPFGFSSWTNTGRFVTSFSSPPRRTTPC
jgi:hypothetical protein